MKPLQGRAASYIAQRLRDLRPENSWAQLINQGRPILAELCCSPTSILSTTMERKAGPNSTMRMSGWNGCMLGTRRGEEEARRRRAEARPKHLWVATRCGPYSQMQFMNQGTEEKKKALEHKREIARKEYASAIKVCYDQVADGGHVHWEWPDGCGGYQLRMVRKMIDDLGLVPARVAGCMMGVVDPETGRPMRKLWKIMTTSPEMVRRMSVMCDGSHEHVTCWKGKPEATAYYPDRFANKAVEAMLAEESKHDMQADLAEVINEEISPSDKSDGEEEEATALVAISEKERREIHRHLQSIHSGSGHCSNEALVRALKRKGARPEVIVEARRFTCPSCQETLKQGARPQATLEMIPPKWKNLQADQFEWLHPVSKVKAKCSLMIDENCRVRIGKVLYHMVGDKKRKNVVWPELKTFFEQHWLPYFGQPQRVRVDPEGAWMATEAAEYFCKQSCLLDPIPGQAHWQGLRTQQNFNLKLAEDHGSMELC